MNHAETLIKVTEEYTLRPRTGDRVNVCIAVLEYLLNNLAFDHDDNCGYIARYVDAEDIENLIHQMKKLK